MTSHLIGQSRIVVTGAGGQLGSELCRILGVTAVPLDVAELDITAADQVVSTMAQIQPDVIINTAAYTAVDRAEDDPDRCFAVNSEAVKTMSDFSARAGCTFVQISTDYVFGGTYDNRMPHRENDPVSPQGVYAKSKLQSEIHARRNSDHLIIRTCGLYGHAGPTSSNNFVTTMLRLGKERNTLNVVDDQYCTPTNVAELAPAIIHLLSTRRTGTYHIVNQGCTTWHEMAREIFRLTRISCRVRRISTDEYNARAPRPTYSVLDTSKYVATNGPTMSTWQNALADYLEHLIQASGSGGTIRP